MVDKTGDKPGVIYGAAVVGLFGRSFPELRQSNAVATACGGAGASLTTRLALGGADFADIDPAVSDAAAPLLAIAALVWDELVFRGCVVDAWSRRARIGAMWRGRLAQHGRLQPA